MWRSGTYMGDGFNMWMLAKMTNAVDTCNNQTVKGTDFMLVIGFDPSLPWPVSHVATWAWEPTWLALWCEVFMNMLNSVHGPGGHAGSRLIFAQYDQLRMALLSAVRQLSSWLRRRSRFPFLLENIFAFGDCHSHGCYSCDKASPALLEQGLFLGSCLLSLSLICRVSAVN